MVIYILVLLALVGLSIFFSLSGIWFSDEDLRDMGIRFERL